MALKNLRIGSRLGAGIAAMLVLSLAGTASALYTAGTSADATQKMMEQPLAKERLVADWYVMTYSAIARTSMLARSSDDTLAKVFAKPIADSVTNTTAIVKDVEARLSSGEEKDAFKSIVALRKKYQDAKVEVTNARMALNAAVEAARAGEQGRGFAVVASEVPNLAQRSASAAKDIKTLIDDSMTQVYAGTTLVRQAGAAMGDVVWSVARVTDMMSEITSAGHEQRIGIDQVNEGIAQMDQVTQQNAALVEVAAAAAASMQQQAARLMQVAAGFSLAAQAAPAASARLAARPPVRARAALAM
jgi:hypothetical protein